LVDDCALRSSSNDASLGSCARSTTGIAPRATMGVDQWGALGREPAAVH